MRTAAAPATEVARVPGWLALREPAVRAMVVEDSPGLNQLLCLLLDLEDDFTVVGHPASGAEALAQAAASRPDLVVLDLELPDIDGFAALGQLRGALPDAKIVIFSACEAARYAAQARAAGADGYIEKDAAALSVVQRLREFCAGS